METSVINLTTKELTNIYGGINTAKGRWVYIDGVFYFIRY